MSSDLPPLGSHSAKDDYVEATVTFENLDAETLLPETTMAFDALVSERADPTHFPAVMNYSVREEVGRGGMAKIFSADDPLLNRQVAVKVSTADPSVADTLFLKEAEVLANLAHPNIPPIHSRGTDDLGRAFYSMKLIHGQTLQRIIKQLAAGDAETLRAFTLQRLLEIFRKVCDAVAFAHAKGYLHRDLKPENIMVGEYGEVLVMDWGLAVAFREHAVPQRPGAESGAAGGEGTIRLQGTPQYMSPEQVEGMVEGLDERSDVYSLGGVLYAILTTHSPVSGTSLKEVLQRVSNGEIAPMPRFRIARGPAGKIETPIPEALRAVTFKALSRERSDRYAHVDALVADIEAYQGGFATSAEQAGVLRQVALLVKRNRIAASFAALLMLVAAGFTIRLAQSERLSRLRAEEALAEKKAARRSAAEAQLAVAENAERDLNASEVRRSLQAVPEELREQHWHYLDDRLNAGLKIVQAKGEAPWSAFEAVAQKAGLFFTLEKDGWIRSVDANTGAVGDLLQVDSKDLSSEFGVSPDGALVLVTRVVPKAKNAPQNAPQMAVFEGYDIAEKKMKYSGQFVHDRFNYVFHASGAVWGLRFPRSGVFSVRDAATGGVLWEKHGMGYYYAYSEEGDDTFSLFTTLKQRLLLDSFTGQDRAPARRFMYPPTIPGNAGVITVSPSGAEAFIPSKEGLDLADTIADKKKFTLLPPAGKAGPRAFGADWNQKLLFCGFRTGERDGLLQVHSSPDGKKLQTFFFSMPNTITDMRIVTHPRSKHVALICGRYMKAWAVEPPGALKQLEVAPREPVALTHSFCFGENSDTAIANLAKPANTFLTLEDLTKKDTDDAPQTNVYQFTQNYAPTVVSSADGKTVAVYNPVVRNGTRVFPESLIFKAQNGKYALVARREMKVFEKRFQLSPSGKYLWHGSHFFEAGTLAPLNNLDRSGFTLVEETASTSWVGEDRIVEIASPQAPQSEEEQEVFGRVLLLWSREEGKPLASSTAPYAAAVSASPDGAQVAEGGADFRLRVRDGKTLQIEREMRVHDAAVTAVAWHPVLPVVATASEDRTVKIWDLRRQTVIQRIGIFINLPNGLHWSPDGRRLAVQSVGAGTLIEVFGVDCGK